MLRIPIFRSNTTPLILWLLVLVTSFPLWAQAKQMYFEQVLDANQLHPNFVVDIEEDGQGFIWLSTGDTLQRFDGYDTYEYRHDSEQPHSLPNAFLNNLYGDKKGRLWITSTEGLARYNPTRDDFTIINNTNSKLLSNNIKYIGENYLGELWIADESNLYKLSEPDNELIRINQLGDKAPPQNIVAIYSEQHFTWIGTLGNGIYLLDHATQQLINLNKENKFGIQIPTTVILDIKKIADRYWLVTPETTYLLDLAQAKLTTLKVPNQANNSHAILQVKTLTPFADGSALVSLEKGGLRLVPRDSEYLSPLINSNASTLFERRLTEQAITSSVYQDTNGVYWLGTYNSGLVKYVPQFNPVEYFKQNADDDFSLSGKLVWALNEDKQGYIWIATFLGGLNKFDPNSEKMHHFLTDDHYQIFDMKIDNEQKIWLATSNGLHLFSSKEDGSLQKQHTFFAGRLIDSLTILDGKIWHTGHENSLTWIDSQSLEVGNELIQIDGLIGTFPRYFDQQKQILWLASNLGLLLYEPATGKVTPLNIKIDAEFPVIRSIAKIGTDYWLATEQHGLIQLSGQSLQPVRIIPSNYGLVASALFEEETVWLGAEQGIVKVQLSSGKTLSIFNPQMLYSNELAEGAIFRTRAGAMLFGGVNGFHRYNPNIDPPTAKDRHADITPAPIISQFQINNGHPITYHDKSTHLQKPIHLAEKITLNEVEKRFKLRFAQLNPIDNKAYSFRYMLQGIDSNWVSVNQADHRQAFFDNLPYGSHKLLVQSRSQNGEWSPSRVLTIRIVPPFWLGSEALIFYLILTSMLLIAWLRHQQLRRANARTIEENEERLKLTLWSSGDELWDWDINGAQLHRANTWGSIDFPQDDIRSSNNSQIEQANIKQNDIPRVQKALQDHLDDNSEFYEVAYRTRTFQGKWIWVLDRGKVVKRNANNQALRMTGTLKNISHLKAAEEQLKLFERSIETISDGVFIADTNFRFISVNKSYCLYTGETPQQAYASHLKFSQYPPAFTAEVKKALRSRGNWLGEIESRRINGDKYELELNIDAIKDEDGKTTHYVGVFSDITTRKSTEKELLKLTNTDPLTDLSNRSFFQASHSNLVRRDAHHALICMDMDNFKKINDSLGHQTGDILIKQIARRLQNITGNQATCYRLGGDEFSILLENDTDIHSITRLVKRILEQMIRPFIINKQDFVLGASIGIAFYPEDGLSPQELLKNADTAMYFAKNSGGNNYQFFSGEMNKNAVRQLQIENLIRRGLKDDLFTVFYQPKVDIASGKLVGMEALVRLEHSGKGVVSPNQFIPLAEQTGQIIEIGEAVLRQACKDTKRWVQMGLFTGRVSVNISGRQFKLIDLAERIQGILDKAALSPLHLECEITEGTLMDNPEQAMGMMEKLRERGIHLALDDFGTGYSSLAYLKQFPLNTVKIDKAFIDDIAHSNVDRQLTASIINIAHNLGLKVVAEGVEHEEQLSILRQYECEMLQGYLYSKPLTASRFERLLKENHKLHKLIHQQQ